jgi:hypothetical protein
VIRETVRVAKEEIEKEVRGKESSIKKINKDKDIGQTIISNFLGGAWRGFRNFLLWSMVGYRDGFLR